jgi:hypothetical protein
MPEIVDPLNPSEPENAFTHTRALRHDGWTPARKRLFLERFAECGIIVEACEAAGMSARSAYNLRDRDPLFAAGWDAASVKSRTPLADEAYSRARNGVVQRIYKDGVVIAERHRYDNRLTMAVLTRLDARIDRAEEKGAAHLAVAARWDEYLAALAEDRDADAAAGNAGHRELRELHGLSDLCRGLGDDAEEDFDDDDPHSVWQEDGDWFTDNPPPAGFDGEEEGRFGQYGYRRSLSEAESAALEAGDYVRRDELEEDGEEDEEAAELARAEARRDRFFGFTRQPEDHRFGEAEDEAEAPASAGQGEGG